MMAEVALVSADIQEVIGSAIAIKTSATAYCRSGPVLSLPLWIGNHL
jgi:hypothetical protein